ncbi:bifunctional histidinol-phosphatase/imidazoleglycerol-phosphate dehydratase HisB [Ornithinimicrobium sp. INDO-MA30-4]|uniref:bifunctional histidinol-phosphatase/imidazoleglycerol-phosphate dehydratase HisB n=1 Tax=Ornithinimicrobium sp. INDO-MA30-4 TaxID=2908651 RepID=UPI001F2D7A33|nr:bifunctional histidinol-phosphatase/imidazoleglycerol-phosphate dehydratase HisB [Ornithinimicrobium sp. INDO-MA30-4]UJH71149.1 bifunctional histidinol-phosphatase/imidazoleglycerol-phosphate dehydratase HisB [Ornithinimicrobium sp. INDO-MA30-4]
MSAVPAPVLFVDRDGTLIEEPADFQIDSYDKLSLVEGTIPALLRLRDAGWQFVMVTNQDGLGTEAFPQADFDGPHNLMMQIFASQGITFKDVLIDASTPEQNAPTRKPGTALMTELLKDRSVDWDRSVMVGDRHTDVEFADNLGIRSFVVAASNPETAGVDTSQIVDWDTIAHQLVNEPRTATIKRKTSETAITVTVDLDRAGHSKIDTGVGFLDHMLDQLAKHGGFSMIVSCHGDLHIDEHHSVEDVAIAVGEAIRTALGDKRGIARYGFTAPMDEAQATAALDLSGRPFFVFEADFDREQVGDLPTEMVEHFWRSFADAMRCTLHLSIGPGNTHHQVEVGFKAVARALRMALPRTGNDLPSTKGML